MYELAHFPLVAGSSTASTLPPTKLRLKKKEDSWRTALLGEAATWPEEKRGQPVLKGQSRSLLS
jgi:hypothetical protein